MTQSHLWESGNSDLSFLARERLPILEKKTQEREKEKSRDALWGSSWNLSHSAYSPSAKWRDGTPYHLSADLSLGSYLCARTSVSFFPQGCSQCLLSLDFVCMYVYAAAAKSLQLCPALCNPIDGSPPGSPVLGILQARTLEWVAISFSNAWKWRVKVKSLSCVRVLATPWTAACQAPPFVGFSR